MSFEQESRLRTATRTLAEIAHGLESFEAGADRMRRSLHLLRAMIPYGRCTFLEVVPGRPAELLAVPEQTAEEEASLRAQLFQIFRWMEDEEHALARDARGHLALPVIGLERIIGILRVEASEGFSYDADHLRLLSVVAAQLGAYLTTLYLRDQDAKWARELAAAHDFQQLLVGTVSHDLRNPLSVISLATDVLFREASNPRANRALARIQSNAKRAERIIHDLLDVTQARVRGGLPISRTRADLVDVLEGVVEDARIANPDRRVSLRVSGPPTAFCDEARIAQAVTNLIGNALQHGEPGGPVSVALQGTAEEVRVSVHNLGPALPEALLPSLFDPFRRGAVGGRMPRGGLGLGLYIVNQIARAHGGRTEARSSAEAGTTFTVIFPRNAHEEERERPAPEA